MVPVPVASMATATAPAAVAAADNGGHGSSSASQNASGSGQGQGGNVVGRMRSVAVMEKGSSSTPSAANTSEPMLGQAATAAIAATTVVPMTNFQLFGSMVPVPVASMATATAPAA
uniref:Uncharacterized protein n=1 Tax=Oryza glumipatula TaxID=40148 RepID=A0A0D9ZYG3_9ORYZ